MAETLPPVDSMLLQQLRTNPIAGPSWEGQFPDGQTRDSLKSAQEGWTALQYAMRKIPADLTTKAKITDYGRLHYSAALYGSDFHVDRLRWKPQKGVVSLTSFWFNGLTLVNQLAVQSTQLLGKNQILFADPVWNTALFLLQQATASRPKQEALRQERLKRVLHVLPGSAQVVLDWLLQRPDHWPPNLLDTLWSQRAQPYPTDWHETAGWTEQQLLPALVTPLVKVAIDTLPHYRQELRARLIQLKRRVLNVDEQNLRPERQLKSDLNWNNVSDLFRLGVALTTSQLPAEKAVGYLHDGIEFTSRLHGILFTQGMQRPIAVTVNWMEIAGMFTLAARGLGLDLHCGYPPAQIDASLSRPNLRSLPLCRYLGGSVRLEEVWKQWYLKQPRDFRFLLDDAFLHPGKLIE